MSKKCRLCLQVAEVRKSHVIPEFAYKALNIYDEKHRFCAFSTDLNVRVDTHQKGLREKLLCDTCEGRLSMWESYAKKVLFGGVALDFEMDEQLGAIAHGVDYEKFKLFAMSLLWRASVSTLKTFENVNLGPHENKLRKLLLEEKAEERWCYGCGLVFAPGTGDNGEQPFSMTIGSPDSLRFKTHSMYRFMLGQMFWLFPVSSLMRRLEADGFYFSVLEKGDLVFFNGGAKARGHLKKFAYDLMV